MKFLTSALAAVDRAGLTGLNSRDPSSQRLRIIQYGQIPHPLPFINSKSSPLYTSFAFEHSLTWAYQWKAGNNRNWNRNTSLELSEIQSTDTRSWDSLARYRSSVKQSKNCFELHQTNRQCTDKLYWRKSNSRHWVVMQLLTNQWNGPTKSYHKGNILQPHGICGQLEAEIRVVSDGTWEQ